jgi:hypothetical protein
MTDALEAIARLTQLRGPDPVGDYYPRVSDLRADVLTLLSTVEQMREALKNLNDIRNGEGGTLRVDPETGWPLAWGECPVAPKEVSHG